jgi:hypothetical protein
MHPCTSQWSRNSLHLPSIFHFFDISLCHCLFESIETALIIEPSVHACQRDIFFLPTFTYEQAPSFCIHISQSSQDSVHQRRLPSFFKICLTLPLPTLPFFSISQNCLGRCALSARSKDICIGNRLIRFPAGYVSRFGYLAAVEEASKADSY